MPEIASSKPAEQFGPVTDPAAQRSDGRPRRQRQRVGADQPDQIGQRQHHDHEQRKQRIERRQRAPPAPGGQRKSGNQRQETDRSQRRQQQKSGFDRPCEPNVAAALTDQLPGMQQQQRPERACQHQRTEFAAVRTERHHRHGQQHRERGLLSAYHGPRQQIQRPERDDPAKLRQQIDAEHVIAGGAESDIGKPERQRRTEIGPDPVFPAIGEHGGEIAGRTSIEQHRQDQPQRRLRQHREPNDQPRPGADQFDNQRGETHEMSEMPKRTLGPDPRPCLISNV